jgi:hypothetical protein
MRFTLPALAAAAATLLASAVSFAPAASAATRVSTKTLLGQLVVRAEHTSGYARSKFPLWIDADHDGCDTRHEVLINEAKIKPHVGASCRLTGGKWVSPYDGVTVTDSSKLDIDHLVPLAEAWQSGAYAWTTDTRMRYANDLGYGPDLVAVTAHANRSKGDREPSGYLPPKRSFDCRYEAWWVAVKWRWHLAVNSAEKSWLTTHLRACGWPSVVKPSRPAISRSSGTGGSGSATAGARITAIYFDSPGPDTPATNSSLNAEWVAIKNTSASRKTLTGWTLRDTSSHIYHFQTFSLAAGASAKVHSGSGSNTASNLYWRQSYYVWNNSGDKAFLRNANGTLVDSCAYSSSADPEASC